MTDMNVLVVDDNRDNRRAAKMQLTKDGIRLTVVGTYDEACELLSIYDHSYDHRHFPIRSPHTFDVVLVDLLMPASNNQIGTKGLSLVGEEMPVGIFLALLAAQNGAKTVALLTDSNHHEHPASACLDAFNPSESKPVPFTLGGARVFLSNNRSWVADLEPENLTQVVWRDIEAGKPSVRAKRWDELFNYVLNYQ